MSQNAPSDHRLTSQDLALFTSPHLLPPAPILNLIQVYLQNRLLLPLSSAFSPILTLVSNCHGTMTILVYKRMVLAKGVFIRIT